MGDPPRKIESVAHVRLNPGFWKAATAMLDTGSDYNLISRSFLEEHSQLEQYTECPGLTAVGNLPVPTFGVYPLYLKTRDALGYEHTYLLRFIVADIAPFTLILGEP